MGGPKTRAVAGIVAVVLAQEAVMPQIKLAGRFPDLIAGFVVAVAVTGNAELGAVVGFAFGLIEDLFLAGPFGMSALVYTVIGYSIGLLGETSGWSSSKFATAVAVGVGSGLAVVGYALIGDLLGQNYMLHNGLVRTILVVATFNLIVGSLLGGLAKWTFPRIRVTTAAERVLQR
ncbi:MAG TPA: rod shape-determining protein MreD [Acidimicrobiales bacterium]|nr:rod shape-determining protein MreD [Acidimicrobiales bacterium]